MTTMPVEALKIGDVILPPQRELSLWMRRHIDDKGLPESALHLTITKVYEGAPDKLGRWILVKTQQAESWDPSRADRPFSFKARPHTQWPVIVEAVV